MNDLISRQAAQAINVLPKCYRNYQTNNLDDAYEKGWEDALFSLNAIPTIDPVKHGKWISVPNNQNRICSVCKYEEPYRVIYEEKSLFDYCPHCGAKMDE